MNNRMSMFKGQRADDVLSHTSSRSSDTNDIINSQLSPLHSSGRAVTAKSVTTLSLPINVTFASNKIDVFSSRTHNKSIERSDRLELNNDNILDNALNVKNVNTNVNVAKITEVPEPQSKQQQQQQQLKQQQHQKNQNNSVFSVSLKSINVTMTMNTESFFSSSTSSAASSSSSQEEASETASSSPSSSTASSDEWGGFEQSFKVALHNNEFDLSTLNSNIKMSGKEKNNTRRTVSDNNDDDEGKDDDKRGNNDKTNSNEPYANRKNAEIAYEMEKAHQAQGSDNSEELNTIHIKKLIEEDENEANEEIEEENDGLFIPDTVFQLSCAIEKPQIPYLSESQLIIGSTVWVVDEEDVETIMKIYWQPIHKRVCNGKMKGTVLRHSGNMTLVKFNGANETDSFVLTLPRICLSLKEIAPYDSICDSEVRGIMTACYSNLSPRATRGRATSSNDVSIADNVYRDVLHKDEISLNERCGEHDVNYNSNLCDILSNKRIEYSCDDNTCKYEKEIGDMNAKMMSNKISFSNYQNVNRDKIN